MRTSHALVALLAATWLGCSQHRPARDRDAGASELPRNVLVTVNGKAITEADLELKTRPSRHEMGEGEGEPETPTLTAAQKKAALESIVQQELEAQRAHELGLDRDPVFQEELAKLQASIDSFRRQRLSGLYQHHVRDATKVTDDDARRYFREHEQELQTELHVMQILMRDETRIEQAHREIQAGTPFEQVAARMFPTLPEGTRPPWDLGFLRYNQLPEQWRGVVDRLQEGHTSDVIRGPRNRFWIVKLVEKRRDPNVGFETWRPNIIEILRAERLEASRAEEERELRRKAKIRYVRDPRP